MRTRLRGIRCYWTSDEAAREAEATAVLLRDLAGELGGLEPFLTALGGERDEIREWTAEIRRAEMREAGLGRLGAMRCCPVRGSAGA